MTGRDNGESALPGRAPAATEEPEERPAAVELRYQDFAGLRDAAPGPRRAGAAIAPDYADIVDFIIRLTHRIWEERAVGLIYDHYRHTIDIHTSAGDVYGRDQVIADSMATMVALPDLRLFADDVIWSGDAAAGYHTSHRITWVGHNTGPSRYGPATGRKVVRAGIAHCLVHEGVVVEEWIARDELALVLQLGLDPWAVARELARERPPAPAPGGFGEVERLVGQDAPPAGPAGDGIEARLRRTLHDVWNRRRLDRVRDHYAPGCLWSVPPAAQLYGPAAYAHYVLTLLAAFPDGRLAVDHVCFREDGPGRYRAAVRWTFEGTHTGRGRYGAPTGRRVRLLGITHQHVEDDLCVREWLLFDELALLTQLTDPA